MPFKPDKEWKPWWAKTMDFDTQAEKEEFFKGAFGPRPINKDAVITGLIAGYVGGRFSQRGDKRG